MMAREHVAGISRGFGTISVNEASVAYPVG